MTLGAYPAWDRNAYGIRTNGNVNSTVMRSARGRPGFNSPARAPNFTVVFAEAAPSRRKPLRGSFIPPRRPGTDRANDC